ncbi:hypothetical protein LTR78_009866 [Recurvomyces mirabilis]|uniref:Major facilitator superfamily (MFS) profile domain-containing protein n=1 Tax=Recurvomyces mirabilis TaxID=574656 RepID=A0AAE0TQQ7_9PEZI|nr:hypothetical protein LTR78_009866 [Recurvomyces mirabilis]KAK5150541.1 hypothetical protein LTS14_010035 [Recurvomyces mirabilis]
MAPNATAVESVPQAEQEIDHTTDDPSLEAVVPELTWRSGLAAAGSALAYFFTVGLQNAFGIFQEYYTSYYLKGESNFKISWLGSFTIFTMFIFAPGVGILADKVGPLIPVSLGSVLLLVAIFMTSLCRQYYQFFLAQGVLLGIGMSFIAIPASGMVPRYFKRNRGLATGITVAGSSLGGIIWPIAFNQMLHHDGIGFPWAMRIAGFVMIPLCIICILTIRMPAVPKKQSDVVVEGVTFAGSEKGAPEKKKDLSVLRKPPFVLLCLGLFFGIFGFFIPIFYVSTYAVHIGMSSSLAFYLVSIVNGASLFGRILPGIVGDHLGRFNMLAFSMFAASIVAFCWTAATSVAGLVVWTVVFGFTSGAILSLQLACATTLADADSAGAAVGTVMGAVSLA